jgi:hypothetical protein
MSWRNTFTKLKVGDTVRQISFEEDTTENLRTQSEIGDIFVIETIKGPEYGKYRYYMENSQLIFARSELELVKRK